MLLFAGSSLRAMTGNAARGVPLDWQGPVSSRAEAVRIAAAAAGEPGVLQASPAATAPFASAARQAASGSIHTGSGSVLAVPPGYLGHLKTFRLLRGSLVAGRVVLDEQLAATLRARVGDAVALTPHAGATPRTYRVSGIALVTAPDVLFQRLEPLPGPAPARPPGGIGIAILPLDTFARTYAPALRTPVPASLGSSALPGVRDAVRWQVQVQIAAAGLGSSPSEALRRAGRVRDRVERTLTGQVRFVDNLSASLAAAAHDALYAQILDVVLAAPGALAALGLAYLAALGTASRDRRDLALLRARGGSRRTLLALAAAECLALGVVAGLLGTAVAFAATSWLVRGGVALTTWRALATALACVALAGGGALAARIGASADAFRRTVGEPRRRAARARTPLWRRLPVDVGALALGGVVYWLTARTGLPAVANPDSQPTPSLAAYMFLAPALLWLGGTLLLVRLGGRVVAWLARRAAGSRPTTRPGFLLASAGRRGAALDRGLVVVGLLLSFGAVLGVFAATYERQARADAQLALGADVVAAAPPGAVAARGGLAAAIAALPGVASVSPVDHSYAYVGPDLQDAYGVDAATLVRTTTLRDSYFVGAGARATLDRLAATADGIVVSQETIADYSLRIGDRLKLRLLDRSTGRFRAVPFHVVGVVQEFPSAPRDSFVVANLGYLAAVGHDGGANVVLVRASGDPVAVARRVAGATRRDGATVRDIREQAPTVSSIAAVDLGGIATVEGALAILLTAGATALLVALGPRERRRELAAMAALGASPGDLAAFLWSEVALALGTALALAAGLGWLLSQTLLAILRHVFDPPPDSLAIPWTFLGALAGAAVAAALVASAVAARGLRRLPLGEILRER